jgi:hypothetical protein
MGIKIAVHLTNTTAREHAHIHLRNRGCTKAITDNHKSLGRKDKVYTE